MDIDAAHADEPSNEDLRRLTRRGLIGLSVGLLGACASGAGSTAAPPSSVASTTPGSTTPGSTTPGSTTPGSVAASGDPTPPACVLVPEETAGPFPIDLSADEQFMRVDIAEDRPGLPLELTLALVDVASGCAPVPGARVDVWHTDAAGDYSGFEFQPSGSTVGQTFCRGIQTTGDDGTVTFRTIFPGWYPGRVAHIHVEVYLPGGRLVAGTQVAFPDAVTDAVHVGAEPYAARGSNPTVGSVAEDFLFVEGADAQTAVVTGDPLTGLRASLDMGIAT